ncbi:dTDP-glucose 4,6-dehydratase [Candidatus Poribacteria bacterium]|nr:dTDP-glucose 4,6-dehydratase [Candidatus Poribacteria bacterium]MYK20034.1 dTDP-glucose 4,6-dehydratase [Candidatus Poribacteria bacterium]
MMKLLVTGGAGFIGTNFIRYWRQHHPDDTLINLDLLTYAGNPSNLTDIAKTLPTKRYKFVHGDILDTTFVEDILKTERPDVIVNFAAESHNSRAILHPRRFFETNVMGTQVLLDAARKYGVARFHHISTCEVYGELALDSPDMFSENAPYRPQTPYNASKAAADHLVNAYFHSFGTPITISNCANNYGPYQHPEKLIPLFTTNALQNLPLTLYRSSHNRREWLHVEDHCRAVAAVITRGKIGETYNVGSGVEKSIEEISDFILDTLGKPQALKTYVPDRPGHDCRYLLDSGKIARDIGWQPKIPFEVGMRETIQWYIDNQEWWQTIQQQADSETVQEDKWETFTRR